MQSMVNFFCMDFQNAGLFSCVQVLTFVAIQLLKQGYTNDRYEGVLQGRGLTGFMSCILPNIEWSEPLFSSFQNLLNRLLKFFKYLQKESSVSTMQPRDLFCLSYLTSSVPSHT